MRIKNGRGLVLTGGKKGIRKHGVSSKQHNNTKNKKKSTQPQKTHDKQTTPQKTHKKTGEEDENRK